jgi:hypothetical protein
MPHSLDERPSVHEPPDDNAARDYAADHHGHCVGRADEDGVDEGRLIGCPHSERVDEEDDRNGQKVLTMSTPDGVERRPEFASKSIHSDTKKAVGDFDIEVEIKHTGVIKGPYHRWQAKLRQATWQVDQPTGSGRWRAAAVGRKGEFAVISLLRRQSPVPLPTAASGGMFTGALLDRPQVAIQDWVLAHAGLRIASTAARARNPDRVSPCLRACASTARRIRCGNVMLILAALSPSSLTSTSTIAQVQPR